MFIYIQWGRSMILGLFAQLFMMPMQLNSSSVTLKLLWAYKWHMYRKHMHNGNTGCRVFKRGIQNWKDFCLKINIPKGNFWFFDIKIDFESQNLALFDTSPLTQFSKFNNFLWVCWFLGKNLSNFVYPAWKLDNPYCHNVHFCRGPWLI